MLREPWPGNWWSVTKGRMLVHSETGCFTKALGLHKCEIPMWGSAFLRDHRIFLKRSPFYRDWGSKVSSLSYSLISLPCQVSFQCPSSQPWGVYLSRRRQATSNKQLEYFYITGYEFKWEGSKEKKRSRLGIINLWMLKPCVFEHFFLWSIMREEGI